MLTVVFKNEFENEFVVMLEVSAKSYF